MIPSIIAEELRKRGLNLEDVMLGTLIKSMGLEPNTVIETRIELTIKYLNEGRELIGKDFLQVRSFTKPLRNGSKP